jgi:DNA invertase Pin-like site-specific DNA recombinase
LKSFKLEQNLDLQQDALKQAGCERICVDKLSGALTQRPGLEQVKDVLREGDTLVVWRLNRLMDSSKAEAAIAFSRARGVVTGLESSLEARHSVVM